MITAYLLVPRRDAGYAQSVNLAYLSYTLEILLSHPNPPLQLPNLRIQNPQQLFLSCTQSSPTIRLTIAPRFPDTACLTLNI